MALQRSTAVARMAFLGLAMPKFLSSFLALVPSLQALAGIGLPTARFAQSQRCGSAHFAINLIPSVTVNGELEYRASRGDTVSLVFVPSTGLTANSHRAHRIAGRAGASVMSSVGLVVRVLTDSGSDGGIGLYRDMALVSHPARRLWR